jgi:hypothetical protein
MRLEQGPFSPVEAACRFCVAIDPVTGISPRTRLVARPRVAILSSATRNLANGPAGRQILPSLLIPMSCREAEPDATLRPEITTVPSPGTSCVATMLVESSPASAAILQIGLLDDEDIALDVGALHLAALDHPDADLEPYVSMLNAITKRVAALGTVADSAAARADAGACDRHGIRLRRCSRNL